MSEIELDLFSPEEQVKMIAPFVLWNAVILRCDWWPYVRDNLYALKFEIVVPPMRDGAKHQVRIRRKDLPVIAIEQKGRPAQNYERVVVASHTYQSPDFVHTKREMLFELLEKAKIYVKTQFISALDAMFISHPAMVLGTGEIKQNEGKDQAGKQGSTPATTG